MLWVIRGSEQEANGGLSRLSGSVSITAAVQSERYNNCSAAFEGEWQATVSVVFGEPRTYRMCRLTDACADAQKRDRRTMLRWPVEIACDLSMDPTGTYHLNAWTHAMYSLGAKFIVILLGHPSAIASQEFMRSTPIGQRAFMTR